MEKNNPMATEKISRLMITFAVPAVLSMLVDAVYNIADQIFIGHGVGYLGITATTVAVPFITIMLAVSTMLGIGSSVYISMKMGKNENDDAERMLGTAFILAVIAGTLLMITGLVFLRPIAYAFGATEASLPYVLDYTSIILIGAPFSMIAVTLSSIARSDGSPVYVMICFLSCSILDLIANGVYIFGFGWGVKGAAISTVTSQILNALLMILYFRNKGKLRLRIRNLLPAPPMCRLIASFGIPACTIQIAEALFQVVMNNSLRTYGTNVISSDIALGTIGIVIKVSSILISVCVGIAIGIQPLLGYNKGAGLNGRVRELYRRAVLTATAVAVTGWLICELFPAPILGIFGLNDPAYLSFAVRSMRIFMLAMFSVGFQVITANYFLAVGQPLKSLVLVILRPVLLMIPLLCILPQIWGLDGILYASAAAGLIAPLIMTVVIKNEFKVTIGG